MEATELQWRRGLTRRRSELTALSQALMLLIGALAVMLMLWMASGVGGNTQPGALIALLSSARWRLSGACARSSTVIQHLGGLSPLRFVSLINGQKPGDLSAGRNSRAGKVTLTLPGRFVFVIPTSRCALNALSLQANLASMCYSGAYRLRKIQRCCSYSPAPAGPATRRGNSAPAIFRYPR